MSKMKVRDLIGAFQLMARERWPYAAGTDERGIDCSGAFVWAYRQQGKSIYHGSNRIARREVVQLLPIDSATVVAGMAAFKHRQPGADGYALPSGYKPGGKNHNGDLKDYYHIGLVDEDTSRVLNARSAQDGFVSSPITQGWSYVAYLSQVDYGSQIITEEAIPMAVTSVAIVRASSGSTVKMRGKPDTSYGLYWDIPVGETVQVLENHAPEGWAYIQHGGQRGYIMDKFLQNVEDVPEEGESDAVPADGSVSILLDKDTASSLMAALKRAGVS